MRSFFQRLCLSSVFFLMVLSAVQAAPETRKTGEGGIVTVRTADQISALDGKILPAAYERKPGEFRGVWVATVHNIDFKKCTKAEDFRRAFREMAENLAAAKFTAILFQVRPMNDAFYPSAINPWSRFLTGKEGGALDEPFFDPLAFMIGEAHKRGLEFHAWLNPYRVANHVKGPVRDCLRALNPENFAAQNPDLVLAVPEGGGKHLLILNPGEPEVVNFLLRTVKELVEKYPLDGIHFDDYFYPYQDIGTLDEAAWKKYAAPGVSLEDWRRENVNTLVRSVHSLIRRNNRIQRKNVRFGVSPFGIWANRTSRNGKTPCHPAGSPTHGSQSYFRQYADTRKWVREGWLDYIAPQLYWSFNHRAAPYAPLAGWWADTVKGTGVDLYIGHGIYRQGTATDWADPDELTNQLLFNCLRPEIGGSILFSYIRMFHPGNSAQKNASRKMIEEFWDGVYPVR